MMDSSKTRIDLTMICCYNNEKVLNECLLDSYKKQTVTCELILIDNIDGKYTSAAEALNAGAKQAEGRLLMFSHQDIVFNDSNALKNLYDYYKKGTIMGVAGVKKGHEGVITWINGTVSGIERLCVEVETVDECLFWLERSIYNLITFDEFCCDNWHLYAADLCLTALQKGIKVIVVPAEVQHLSSGNRNQDFYRALRRIKKKYRGVYKYIYTCCISMEMRIPVFYYQMKEWYWHNIKKII